MPSPNTSTKPKMDTKLILKPRDEVTVDEVEEVEEVTVPSPNTSSKPKPSDVRTTRVRKQRFQIDLCLDDDDDEEEDDNKDEDDDDDDDDEEFKVSHVTKKSKSSSTVPTLGLGLSKGSSSSKLKTPKSKKISKEKVPTLEQERRRIGDAVKANIHFLKWAIDASTHATLDMSFDVFKANIIPHAKSVVPVDLSIVPEVAVARISGFHACGEAFGKSKIVGGSRVQQWSADECDVIWKRCSTLEGGTEGKADIWFSMR